MGLNSPSNRNQFYEENGISNEQQMPFNRRRDDDNVGGRTSFGNRQSGSRLRKRLIDAQMRSSVDLRKRENTQTHMTQNFQDQDQVNESHLANDNESHIAKFSGQQAYSNQNQSSSNQQTPFGLQEKMIMEHEDGLNLSNEPSIQNQWQPQPNAPPQLQQQQQRQQHPALANFKINSMKKVTLSKDQIKLYNPTNKENRVASVLNAPGAQQPSADIQKINFHGGDGLAAAGGSPDPQVARQDSDQ